VFTLGGRVDHAYSVRRTREAARITVLGAGLLVASLASAAAQDPHSEIFTGLEASNNADLGTTFDGEASYGAALIGYQFRTQALFLKLFAGVEAEDQSITPRDPENSVQGSAVGLKLAAENWLDLSPLWFLSVDASYGTAFQQYWSLARAGYRLSPRFSLGLEGGALGNEEYDAGRGGGFVKANLRQPGAHALRRLHRKLSRRRTERLCVARRLSRLLRRTGCTAGPAPAVLSSSAWRFAEG
jgi:hypothetical protein